MVQVDSEQKIKEEGDTASAFDSGAEKSEKLGSLAVQNEDDAEDDTVSASTGGAFDTNSLMEEPPMPIMKYLRISGLPRSSDTNSTTGSTTTATADARPLSDTCSCSSLAQVLLSPWNETSGESNLPTLNYTNSGGGSPATNNQHEDPQQLLRSDLWSQQPFYIVAAGFQTGKVSLLSVANGQPVLSQPELTVKEGSGLFNSSPPPVIAVSFDSSGTALAAIDESGTCAVWEFKYYPTLAGPRGQGSRSTSTSQTSSTPSVAAGNNTTAAASEDNMFSSFMSALTGMPPPEASSPTRASNSSQSNSTQNGANSTINRNTPGDDTSPALCLASSVVQVSRATYPSNWKSPTCMVLDPAYKRKREKSFCVGFSDGRLLLTKRGGLFSRRNDTVLFQGSGAGSASSSRGIECIAWRASFVAWADSSGIKLMDVDTLTRIAHIDRPTGARPSLYPTIAYFKPHLYFETADTLLVCWGDCLMTMNIKGATPPTTSTSGAAASTTEERQPRRSVECSMAWELEGVACGVVPIDEDHVGILALVTPEDEEGDNEQDNDNDAAVQEQQESNDLEVQILSRKDGNLLYCDSLPLIKPMPINSNNDDADSPPLPSLQNQIESAAQYMMLSTFALPRMDNSAELEEYSNWTQYNPAVAASGAMEEFDMNVLFSAATGIRDSNKSSFVEPHLKWKIESVLFENEDGYIDDDVGEDGDDNASVDSDDYAFALRPIVDESMIQTGPSPSPPSMIVASGSDMVLVRMVDIDDAVGNALTQQRPAMALSRGLRHRRQLRRYQLGDLVDNYLQAVLKVGPPKRQLSLRRMKMAVQSMPILLGGQIDSWEKWSSQLEKIPGSLFLLRNYLPVRGKRMASLDSDS